MTRRYAVMEYVYTHKIHSIVISKDSDGIRDTLKKFLEYYYYLLLLFMYQEKFFTESRHHYTRLTPFFFTGRVDRMDRMDVLRPRLRLLLPPLPAPLTSFIKTHIIERDRKQRISRNKILNTINTNESLSSL